MWRSFRQQCAISRNLGDGRLVFVLRMFWSVVFILKGIRAGLACLGSPQLGSVVVHRGKRWSVSNFPNGPTVSLVGLDNEGWVQAPVEETHPVAGVGEFCHRFRFGWSFYFGNWHGIDVQRRVIGFYG